jgi:hypothetical protein
MTTKGSLFPPKSAAIKLTASTTSTSRTPTGLVTATDSELKPRCDLRQMLQTSYALMFVERKVCYSALFTNLVY